MTRRIATRVDCTKNTNFCCAVDGIIEIDVVAKNLLRCWPIYALIFDVPSHLVLSTLIYSIRLLLLQILKMCNL